MIPSRPLVEEALSYAQSGWSVFPLSGKIPYKGTHGHRDATTDEAVIRAMWHEYPTANIGVATGSTSGILVLDIDTRHNGHTSLTQLEGMYDQLPHTKTARTPHNGLHLYFQHPQDSLYPNTQGVLGEGLDTRGDGGYVVVPPSTLYGRTRYLWGKTQNIVAPLPDFLHELLPHQRKLDASSPQGGSFALPTGEKWLTQAVADAQEGNRNQIGFFLALQLRDDGVSEEDARHMLISYARSVPSGTEAYTIREALASVKSAYSRPARPRAKHQ